ncbi:Crp/Fnr family transcriptional regulator [Streptomyces sp. NPDC085927]|uniref:Crp/Fnr family transcriptional regulator n=1 Tax=Streptomyces sp. NPDC085927 TaxID=3365738 RepID=UPI0037CE7F76
MTERGTQEPTPSRRSLRDFTGEGVWADLLEHSFERRHPAGSVLLRQGEPGTHVLTVVTGVAKVIRQERNGDLSLLAFRGPGELLGEVAVLDDGVRSANAESISPCTVGVMRKAEFLAFVGRHGLFPVLVRYALTRLRESDEARGGGDVRTRLAAALVHLIDISGQPHSAQGTGGPVELALTRHELAQHLGTSRNTVTAALNDLASCAPYAAAPGVVVHAGAPDRAVLLGGDGAQLGQCPVLASASALRPCARPWRLRGPAVRVVAGHGRRGGPEDERDSDGGQQQRRVLVHQAEPGQRHAARRARCGG